MRYQPGDIIDGRFEVLRLLGAGGMGEVYIVRHVHLDRREALKILLPGLHPQPGIEERFRREARAASMLKHDNIIEVHDFDFLADGTPYYTMELLVGEDLSATLAREGPLPWIRVRKIAFQICRAIALAHDRGIIHRDLKPANCFRMTRDGDPDSIKVLDFGIAKVLAANTITGDGVLIGSPHYMSPEQTRGPLLDPRADVYSLGVVLYELLTGKLPLDADDLSTLIYAIQNTEPLPLRRAAPELDLSPELESLVARAMAKDREARFSSIASMAMAINRLRPADESPGRRRPRPRVDPLGETVARPRDEDGPEDAKTRAPDLAATDEDAATTMYSRGPTEPMSPPAPARGPSGSEPRRPLAAPGLALLVVGFLLVIAGVVLALS
ncbi:MAG: serine/threonine-protein kinase [Nannocystaceae bacterium]